MPTFEQTRQGYKNLWAKMKVTRVADADKVAKRILAGRARYEAIEAKSGVPWFFIGLVHYRESNLNFATYLGNGQSLYHKTTIVPENRGPFKTFEAGALDALKIQGFMAIKDWGIDRLLFCLEKLNGQGYFGKINSPYMWGGTNLQQRGKYTRDHHYDPSVMDTQLGTAAILARLCALSPEVNARVNGGAVVPPPPATKPANDAGKVAGGVIVGGAAAGTAAATQSGWGVMEWAIAIAVLAAVVAGTYFGWRWWKHRNDGKPPEPDEVKREELKEAGLLEQPSIPVWRSETTTLPADKPFAPPSHHAPAVKSRAVRAAVAKARARKAKKAARHG